MKKIPTLFKRDPADRSRVTDELNLECAWVWFGEGWPHRKIDGTCCLVRDGKLFKRRELRLTDAPPPGYERADFDPETGKEVGWVPVGDGPEDRWHREAFSRWAQLNDGTYELVGPKIQGNPEGYRQHELVAHDLPLNADCPRRFDELRNWLAGQDIEGIVWHHPDGRMAKIKLRDFGLKRCPPPPKVSA